MFSRYLLIVSEIQVTLPTGTASLAYRITSLAHLNQFSLM